MANWWDDAPLAEGGPDYGKAISSIESGGNYRAIGPQTKTGDRALGKYQVMGNNVGPWSEEILGRRVTPQEFIQSPEIQDKIFNGKFGQYAEKYGPEGAAKAWFAGEKGMNNPSARDVLGTSVSAYAEKFTKALGPTDVGAQSKPAKNWWDAAPLAQEAPAQSPEFADRPRVQISTAPERADRGAVDAAARGVAQGFTANFGDEIRGLVEASGANPDEPASVYKLISGALKYWSGDKEAKKRYEEATTREREINKTGEEQHPVASIAGNVGGAVLLPVGAAARGASLGQRVAQGMGVGAGFGALAGAGEGEGASDTLIKTGAGGLIGGAVGGAAVPVLSVVEAAGRGIAKAASPVVTNVRGLLNRDAEAARRIELNRQADARTGKPGMTDAEFDAAKAQGLPVVNADRGGENVQALARSAANTSPEGRTALETVTSERYKSQSPRTAQYLKETFDFPEPGPALDRLQEAARRENGPAYRKAYAEGANLPFDEGLLQLSQAPVVQDAIRKAMITAKNEAAKLDLPPPKNPFRFDEDGRLRPMANPDGSMMRPNLQFWDIVKRNLDKTGSPEAKDWARVLREHLDDLVPSYKDARSGAAKFFGAEDALEAGAKYATMSGRDAMSIAEAHKGLSKMGPADRKLFQTGFVSNLIAKIEDLKDGQDIVKQIFNSEFARGQVKRVLGENRAAELEARLTTERAMNGIKNAVQGNSTTVRQWIERGLAGGATGLGGVGAYDSDPQKIGVAALVGALTAGSRHIDTKVARRVAEMLASDNPEILKAGTSIVAKSKALREAFRTLNIPSARVGGIQSPSVPALQAAGVSRAEDQPDVPRPPGQ